MRMNRFVVASSSFALALSVASCMSSDESAPVAAPVAVEPAPEPVVEPVRAPLALNTVYFDFDKYDIRADQQGAAAATAESLKANAGTKVQIQGNTDDRGSVEYNYALGTRRAQSLKDYFVAHGVNASDISTVSYGKERPVAQGTGEAVWAQNRRDDVVAVN